MENKYLVSEFANEIRKLYPGDYDDLSDSRLVELWLKKYPTDKDKIELEPNKLVPASKISNSDTQTKRSNTSYIWLFLILGVIIIGLIKKNGETSSFNSISSSQSNKLSQPPQQENNSESKNISDVEIKKRDILNNKPNDVVAIVCLFCNGTGMSKTTKCPNCSNWNNEYRSKVACEVCQDRRYVKEYEILCEFCENSSGVIYVKKDRWEDVNLRAKMKDLYGNSAKLLKY